MATRQQKLTLILGYMRASRDQVAFEYWRDRLVDLIWAKFRPCHDRERQMKRDWSRADQHKLRTANSAGGARACFAAFPDRTEGAVFSAMRRYVLVETYGEPVKADRDEIRRRTDALTIDDLIDRLPGLLMGGLRA